MRLLVLFFIISTVKAQTKEERLANFRLPGDLVPYHYDIELNPDVYVQENHTLIGTTVISFDVKEATSTIIVNVNGYEPPNAFLALGLAPENTVPAPDPVIVSSRTNSTEQFFYIVTSQPLNVGSKYSISIGYGRDMLNAYGGYAHGFYVHPYEINNQTRFMAVSQFQTSHAREAFPCFDEPEYKATFSVTLVRRIDYKSLSNMPLERNEIRPNDFVADIFERTPVMSTYILCFSVNDFQYLEDVSRRGVVSRIWVRPNALDEAIFANTLAHELIDWFEDYTGINYPLPKLDHIAIPRTSGGAMEHWGLATYGEAALLLTPETDDNNIIRIASTMSHEVAHMWWGNLVTCKWWSDTWLNEGFASYFNYLPFQTIYRWDAEEIQEVRSMNRAFFVDQRNTSVPVRREVSSPMNANSAFVSTTYSKGASVLRMINAAVTPGVFQTAMNRYLTNFSYGSVETQDLWDFLQMQVDDSNVRAPDGSRLNITDTFDPWVRQYGFPLVNMNRTVTPTRQALFEQIHFHNPSDQIATTPSPWNYVWPIPLTVFSEEDTGKTRNTTAYLRDSTVTITEGMPADNKALLLNVDRMGFYRVYYDSNSQEIIKEVLTNRYYRIPVEMRGALLDDIFTVSRSLGVSEVAALDWTKYLRRERGYPAWAAAVRHIRYHDRMLFREMYYGDMMYYWRDKVDITYRYLRIIGDDRRTITQSLTLADIARWACAYNYDVCRDDMFFQFNRWVDDPDYNLEPGIQDTMMCQGIRSGGVEQWDLVYDRYKNQSTWRSAERYHRAMACTREIWLMQRYFDRTRDGDIGWRGAIYIARTDLGRDIVWRHLKEDWNTTSFGGSKRSLLFELARGWYQPSELEEFQDFVGDNPPKDSGEERMYEAVERIVSRNIKWHATNAAPLSDWYAANKPRSDEVPSLTSAGSAAIFNMMTSVSYGDDYKLEEDQEGYEDEIDFYLKNMYY